MIYELILSRGEKIRIDEDDLKHIKENISANLIVIKQGMINPSFLVMIVPTNEPDVVSKPTFDTEGSTAKVTGFEERKVLADLMGSEVKRLTN